MTACSGSRCGGPHCGRRLRAIAHHRCRSGSGTHPPRGHESDALQDGASRMSPSRRKYLVSTGHTGSLSRHRSLAFPCDSADHRRIRTGRNFAHRHPAGLAIINTAAIPRLLESEALRRAWSLLPELRPSAGVAERRRRNLVPGEIGWRRRPPNCRDPTPARCSPMARFYLGGWTLADQSHVR